VPKKFIQKYLKPLSLLQQATLNRFNLSIVKKIITFYNGNLGESRGYRDYIFCKIKKRIMKIIQATN
jgi:hypothetical protein